MPAQTTVTATGLSAATYTVTVTDAHLCTKTTSATITQPTALAASITAQVNVSCNGLSNGSATVNPSGGTSGYTYSWSTTPAQTTATATGLSATTYTVTVTDANLCTKTTSVTISQPIALAASISSQTNVSCNGGTNGTATVNASNGTPGYTYSWSTVPVQTTVTATGLSAAIYTVTVADSNLCTKTVTDTITQPAALTVVLSGTSPVCQGHPTTVSAGIFSTYLWSTGDTTAIIQDTPNTTINYTVTVSNSAGCTASNNFQVTVNPIPVVTITSDPDNIAYVGQVITFTASPSGYTQYTFYVDSTLEKTGTENIYQTMTLTSGQVVSVIVNDNGCTSVASFTDVAIKPIPNAFIPNGTDLTNAVFLKGLNIQILNRWGQELYSGKDGWDGKYNGNLVSAGTYFYIVKLEELNNEVKVLKGSVTVILK